MLSMRGWHDMAWMAYISYYKTLYIVWMVPYITIALPIYIYIYTGSLPQITVLCI